MNEGPPCRAEHENDMVAALEITANEGAAKPHLKLRFGVWWCGVKGDYFCSGFTPREAYDHWQEEAST